MVLTNNFINFAMNRSYTYSYTSVSSISAKHNISSILGLCKSGSFFEALYLLQTNESNINADVKPLIYASLLQTATKLEYYSHGFQFHSHILKSGLLANSLVGNSLLSFYFKLRGDKNIGNNLTLATRLFDEELLLKDVISWTSMISAYVRVNPGTSLRYFSKMLGVGIQANAFTLSSGIKACSVIGDVKLGRCFHGAVLRGGFECSDVVGSVLIDMYGKNGWLGYARRVFVKMTVPDSVCWSSIISALTRNDLYEESLAVFYVMQRGVKLVADEFTYGSVLTGCGNLGRLKQGKEIHGRVITTGLCGNVVVESSLVDMYGKCGRIGDSQRVFDQMRKRNMVSWCALLNGYCQNGLFESVIEVFRMMERPVLYSFGTIIKACAGLAAVRQGKEVHCQYVRIGGGKGHVIVESALVDLYAKCGCIDYAKRLFMQMPVRNLISWNAMICGFAQNGRGHEAIQLFDKMVRDGVQPDYISFLGVIFACSHMGLVDEGQDYFISMTEDYGIKPRIEHCNCMVDLLGRAGLIDEAENLIEKAECKDSLALWPTLLGACTTRENSAAVERIALKMMELDPKNHLSYVHLINVYKCDGRWIDAVKMRKLMEERGAEKLPGRSWVENAFGCIHMSDSNMMCQRNLPSVEGVRCDSVTSEPFATRN